MQKLLSIITVNLNDSVGLRKTAESVICQTFDNYEYIIIDGASSDDSVEVIKNYAGKIAYWVSEPDSGIYNAMNKGIKQAKGRYCLFLNSGDFLVADNVLQQVFSKDHNEDFLIGNCEISKDGNVIHTAVHSDTLTLRSFYKQTIPHQATFIKRDLFKKYGDYSENYKIHSDYEFWIRTIILNDCSTRYLNITISDYNIEGKSSNSAYESMSKNEVKDILHKVFPKRVLEDYENWTIEREEMKVLYWVKSKPSLYKLISIFYSFISELVFLKKSFISPQKKS
jgi:glycosyltransferase involved in cell wall biosynthesis